MNDQTAFGQQGVVVFGEHAGQVAPAVWRVAQAKALGNLARQASAFQVGHCTRGFLEVFAPGLARFFQNVGQGVLACFLGGSAGAVFGRLLFIGHLHTHLLGQVFDSLDKGHAGVLHQEADGITVLAATKAVEKLFTGADREAGRFFAMKRA